MLDILAEVKVDYPIFVSDEVTTGGATKRPL